MNKKQSLSLTSEYFITLLNALNHFEGDSHFFGNLNIDFINYLKAAYIYLDNDAAETIRTKFQREKSYRTHPFLAVTVRILDGKPITKEKKDETLKLIKKYPSYPLSAFLKNTLNHNARGKEIEKGLSKALIKYDVLSVIWLINNKGPQFNRMLRKDVLNKLSAEGLSIATYEEAKLASLYEKDLEKVKSLLIKTARQAGLNAIDFVGENFFYFAKHHTKDSEFAGKLLRSSADLDYEGAFIPLVNYYENATYLGVDRYAYAFYYLTVASFKYIEEAQQRLLDYYKKGHYVPKSERLASDLENIIKG